MPVLVGCDGMGLERDGGRGGSSFVVPDPKKRKGRPGLFGKRVENLVTDPEPQN